MERSGEAQQLREDRELEILLISYLSATIGRRGHKSHELRRPKAQPHPNPNQVQMGLKSSLLPVPHYHYTLSPETLPWPYLGPKLYAYSVRLYMRTMADRDERGARGHAHGARVWTGVGGERGGRRLGGVSYHRESLNITWRETHMTMPV